MNPTPPPELTPEQETALLATFVATGGVEGRSAHPDVIEAFLGAFTRLELQALARRLAQARGGRSE